MTKEITYMGKDYQDKKIEIATAKIEDLDEAYSNLLERADSGGAFPGSKEDRKARVYRDLLNDLIEARPEIGEYRNGRIERDRAKSLENVDILGA